MAVTLCRHAPADRERAYTRRRADLGVPVLLLLLLLLLILLPQSAEAARVALVVGNGEYERDGRWSRLHGPAHDAARMAEVLEKGLKFDRVFHEQNLGKADLLAALARFERTLEPGDTAFFYYSGHGVQVDGQNYLVPVDAPAPSSAWLLRNGTLALKDVLEIFRQRRTGLNVVVLDACRDNPLSGGGKGFGGAGLKGLAREDFKGETLIGFAAAQGEVAADGEGGMSPYTRVLVEELPRPGRSLWEVFGTVGVRVKELTSSSRYPQEPWKNDNLSRSHYLAGPPVDEADPELVYWQEMRTCGTRECLEAFLSRYPGGAYAPAARAGLARLAEEEKERQKVLGLPEMVAIRGGCFAMGSPEDEEGRDDDERQHEVCVEDFRIAKTEVTVGQFRAFVESRGYRTDAEDNVGREGCFGLDREAGGGQWDWRAWASWRKPNKYQANADDHPASCVSWNDALAYVEWIAGQTGKRYRLPTEAEWEYAARGGTTTSRYWGDDPDRACRYANVADRSKNENGRGWSTKHECDDGSFYVTRVGRYEVNGYGLHDMLGNVWEWTCSAYDSGYGGAETRCATKGNGAPRAVRGGSWGYGPRFVRAAHRTWVTPGHRHGGLGFRLAQDL